MLIEIDLEANPIKSLDTVLLTIVTKKDLLVFNLKQSPLAKENPSDLFASASTSDSTQILEEAKALMAMSHNGVLYKSKRVYQKIRAHFQHAQMQAINSKRSISGFSQESSSGA
jgi:hypothetical protein